MCGCMFMYVFVCGCMGVGGVNQPKNLEYINIIKFILYNETLLQSLKAKQIITFLIWDQPKHL